MTLSVPDYGFSLRPIKRILYYKAKCLYIPCLASVSVDPYPSLAKCLIRVLLYSENYSQHLQKTFLRQDKRRSRSNSLPFDLASISGTAHHRATSIRQDTTKTPINR